MVLSMILVQISVLVSVALLTGREMRRGGIPTMQLDVQFTKKPARSHDMAPSWRKYSRRPSLTNGHNIEMTGNVIAKLLY